MKRPKAQDVHGNQPNIVVSIRIKVLLPKQIEIAYLKSSTYCATCSHFFFPRERDFNEKRSYKSNVGEPSIKK